MDKYGYVDVFPTRIHKIKLDTKILPKITFEEENHSKYFDYYDTMPATNVVDILHNPKYKTLNETVLREASKVCPKHESIGEWKIVGAWINKQESKQEGFKFHNHTDSFMSCVLYVEGENMSLIVREEARVPRQSDSTSSCFYDIVIRHSWHPELSLPVDVGDLLVFPSYQIHKANINDTDKNRISIAYNLLPSKIKDNNYPWSVNLKLA